MLDLGWTEMLAIAVVALFVIGPRDLPKTLRTVGRYVSKVRAMARQFQGSIDEAVREAELEDVKNVIGSGGRIDVTKAVRDTIDPDQQLARALDVNDTGDTGDTGAAQPTAAAADDGGARPESGAKAPPDTSPAPAPAQPERPVVARWPSSKPASPAADGGDAAAPGQKATTTPEITPAEQSKAGA